MNTPESPNSVSESELAALKLDRLRENLLNFSRRNPLVNTRLDGKTSRYLRVVDELPQVLYDNLTGGQPMEFTALPEIPDPPADEASEQFGEAVREARLTDEKYAAARKAFETAAAAGRRTRKDPERELKDRVRERLGLPKRVDWLNPPLNELRRHAREHGIEPDFELPRPSETHADGRHTDREIQTLASAEQMRRNLEKVHDDDKTARQEAGVNSLYCAFGFLEWSEPGKTGGTSLSPLLLLPVALKFDGRRRHYSVAGTADEGELNLVLFEKLRREHRVQLPAEFNGDIERYFAAVVAAAPKELDSRLHRYVAFGTFNSTQVAVFNDLDPANWSLTEGPALELLVSSAGAARAGFAPEYPVDAPEFRKPAIAPLLVADADSSQISTIIDMGRGESFALEGPPGSGKSQTIVNTIATALAQGKKVLFVAQKTAALEVVRARLTERGLSDFLLTLQAGRSERQAFREQIKSRIELGDRAGASDYGARRGDFHRHRERLQIYLGTLAERFGRTGLSVHEILSASVAGADDFRLATDELPESCFTPTPDLDHHGITEITEAAVSFEHALLNADPDSRWSGVTVGPLDRFTADRHLRAAAEASASYTRALAAQEHLATLGFGLEALAGTDAAALAERARRLDRLRPRTDPGLVKFLFDSGHGGMLRGLLDECARAAEERAALATVVTRPASPELERLLRDGAETARRLTLKSFDTVEHQAERRRRADRLASARASLEAIELLRPEAAWIDEVECAALDAAARLLEGDCLPFLRLRTRGNTAEGGAGLLAAAIDRTEALRMEREELASLFRLDRGVDPAAARRAAEILETTGAMGRLGGAYRSAKKQYRGLAITPKPFEAADAAANLGRLAAWRNDVDRFIGDHRTAALLGPAFTGLDTDLGQYRRLVSYMREVERRFSGIRYRSLRKLLLEGDTDQLTTLSRIHTADCTGPAGEFTTLIDSMHEALTDMDRSMPGLAACAVILTEPASADAAAASSLADTVAQALARLARIDASPLREHLGPRLAGADTDIDSFQATLDVLAICETDPVTGRPLAALLAADALADAATGLDRYADAVAAGDETLAVLTVATGARTEWIRAVPDCAVRASRSSALAADRPGLQGHSMVHHQSHRLEALGLGEAAAWLRAHPDSRDRASALILAHLDRGLAEAVFDMYGDRLRRFLGTELDDLRSRLTLANDAMQGTAANDLRSRLFQGARPPKGVDRGRVSDYTEMGLLAHVKDLQRNRHPVREVTRRASRALLELKPCWMMSPLAVAQYLSPDTRFDLCIIDEASQMFPGAAMGAVLRAKQVMIVGDNNQLPPSDLFSAVGGDSDDDEDEDLVEEAESVLEMAGKAFPSSRRLRWHYRSRNSSLIAFSNQEIYENQLVVFPSSWEERPGVGVQLEYLPEGCYEKSLNRIEAAAVVDAVARFARTDLDRSLGVVAMNVQQRNLISELLHERAVEDPMLRAFQNRWDTEREGIDALFVKNLENVQGDERDVIFISTVYGPKEPGGAVAQRFGPVNGKPGRRRLNVLFTRAREQLVTFTSMRPSDITAERREDNPGRYMLRRWLEYCANGGAHGESVGSGKPGSRLAEHVGDRLRERGFTVDYEVGTTGHRVDLAVRHPEWRHGYLCGIDCDGEEYHSSHSARDRDILRQQVLKGLGWRLYRVWSVNWYNDGQTELDRLLSWMDDLRRSSTAVRTSTDAESA